MNTNPWMNPDVLPRFPALSSNLRVDVVIVGGGITGITAAYLLKQAGHTVALIERDRIAHGDTGHTTAHLTCVTDLRLHELVDTFGRDDAQAVWDAGLAAVNEIYRIVQRENIQCGFTWVPGYLHAPLTSPTTPEEVELLRKDSQLAEELHFDAAFQNEVPLFKRPGVRFANQALFHPTQYIAALLPLIDGDGSHVFEETEATKFDDKPLRVSANGFDIDCGYVVIATHVPLMGNTGLVSATLRQTRLAPYSTYAIGAKIPRDTCAPASFWDTSDPYYYLRINRLQDHDYAIFGGEDHKTGQESDTNARFERLEALLSSFITNAEVDYRWSGQVIETHDGLPLIGEAGEKQFIATGFAGNGMTFGTLAGMMACDAVAGRKNPWSDLFSTSGIRTRKGAWDYLRENLDYPFYMVKDRLAASEGKSVRTVRRGEGKILRVDGKRVAVYRDHRGEAVTLSCVCPHMGCIVHWNNAEATWDCPCHGSRFNPATGDVLSGPAEKGLAKVEVKSKVTEGVASE